MCAGACARVPTTGRGFDSRFAPDYTRAQWITGHAWGGGGARGVAGRLAGVGRPGGRLRLHWIHTHPFTREPGKAGGRGAGRGAGFGV